MPVVLNVFVIQVFPFINLVTLVYVDALKEATNCIAQNTAQMTFLIAWVTGEYLTRLVVTSSRA